MISTRAHSAKSRLGEEEDFVAAVLTLLLDVSFFVALVSLQLL
jgi:hypothetical protein